MIKQNPLGRRKPYTQIGIRRVECARPRCRRPSRFQWSACAIGGRFIAVCDRHDLEINTWLLTTFRIPGARALLRRYEEAIS